MNDSVEMIRIFCSSFRPTQEIYIFVFVYMHTPFNLGHHNPDQDQAVTEEHSFLCGRVG